MKSIYFLYESLSAYEVRQNNTTPCLYNAILCFLTSLVHVVFGDIMGNMHVYSNLIKDGSQTIHKVVNHAVFQLLLAIMLDVILCNFLYKLCWISPYFSRFAFIHWIFGVYLEPRILGISQVHAHVVYKKLTQHDFQTILVFLQHVMACKGVYDLKNELLISCTSTYYIGVGRCWKQGGHTK